MRKTRSGPALIVLFIAMSSLASAMDPRPDFSGTWSMDLQKSDLAGEPAPSSKTQRVEQEGNALTVVIDEISTQGPVHGEAHYTLDGKEAVNTVFGNALSSTVTWEGQTMVMRTSGDFGGAAILLVDRWSLSPDRNTLTIARRFQGRGKISDQRLVFDRKEAPSLGTEDVLALVGGTVIPGPAENAVPNGVVLVRGGVIVAVGSKTDVKVPPEAKTIDCSGAVVTAGFQNSHVHFTEPKWADAGRLSAEVLTKQFQDMLTRYGVTTAVDTGSFLDNTLALRKRIESGEVAGPRVLTAGTPLYPVNGIPYYLRGSVPDELLAQLPQPATPAEAVALVKQHIAAGADIIKLFTGSWVKRSLDGVMTMRLDVVKAAADEAHREGHLVYTHPSNMAGFKIALDGGVDVLGHAIEDTRGWDASYIPRMMSARMSLVPTLNLFSGDSNIEDILREVGDFSRAGGQVLFGTDVGYQTEYDPTEEFLLMKRAGLGFSQILASLTTAPAARFSESTKRGRIAPGLAGDLVVLEADPAADVRNFARVRMTIRSGRVIYQKPPAYSKRGGQTYELRKTGKSKV